MFAKIVFPNKVTFAGIRLGYGHIFLRAAIQPITEPEA
jgi:hypothetical protein